ncbi:MAG: lipopolysaccharide heptosyltransferase I [Melioribacteraceae bacterium]|nr:MAG: lipopolysaccharide heptosyltransferase I [Melioribacteraceae bacterium]
MINTKDINQILIIKLRGIGDVVLSTIVLKSLRLEFPTARIDYLTEKPGNFLLEPLEEVADILIFKKKTLSDRLKTFLEVRKNKYDLVIDFYSNPGTAQITYFSGAKYRAGFPYKGRKYAYNLYGPSERDKYHAADLHLEFLKNIGIRTVSEPELQFGIFDHELGSAGKFRDKLNLHEKKLVGLSPSGGWQSKKAPAVIFINAAKALKVIEPDIHFLIHWGPGDESDANKITGELGKDATLAPPTSIREMGAFLKICDVVLANDSGPMHICAAVGTPVLGLFGPTSPSLQGPYGKFNSYIHNGDLHCIECNLLQCPHNQECFNELSSSKIAEELKKLLNN